MARALSVCPSTGYLNSKLGWFGLAASSKIQNTIDYPLVEPHVAHHQVVLYKTSALLSEDTKKIGGNSILLENIVQKDSKNTAKTVNRLIEQNFMFS